MRADESWESFTKGARRRLREHFPPTAELIFLVDGGTVRIMSPEDLRDGEEVQVAAVDTARTVRALSPVTTRQRPATWDHQNDDDTAATPPSPSYTAGELRAREYLSLGFSTSSPTPKGKTRHHRSIRPAQRAWDSSTNPRVERPSVFLRGPWQLSDSASPPLQRSFDGDGGGGGEETEEEATAPPRRRVVERRATRSSPRRIRAPPSVSALPSPPRIAVMTSKQYERDYNDGEQRQRRPPSSNSPQRQPSPPHRGVPIPVGNSSRSMPMPSGELARSSSLMFQRRSSSSNFCNGKEWRPGSAVGGTFGSPPLDGRYGTSAAYRAALGSGLSDKIRALEHSYISVPGTPSPNGRFRNEVGRGLEQLRAVVASTGV